MRGSPTLVTLWHQYPAKILCSVTTQPFLPFLFLHMPNKRLVTWDNNELSCKQVGHITWSALDVNRLLSRFWNRRRCSFKINSTLKSIERRRCFGGSTSLTRAIHPSIVDVFFTVHTYVPEEQATLVLSIIEDDDDRREATQQTTRHSNSMTPSISLSVWCRIVWVRDCFKFRDWRKAFLGFCPSSYYIVSL